jgi:hypothetical protein
MTTDTLAAPRRPAPFPPYQKWDRDFFLTYIALVWIAILMGFGSDLIDHFKTHEAPYPLIVHFHAVAFVGWLVLLTTQVLLIRNKRHDIHRALGMAGLGLAAIMVVLGPATAIVMQRAQWGTPDSDPAFTAIQFGGIIAFGTLVTAAALKRNDPSAHKRLMLLAILAISDAGFARWLGGDFHAWLGSGWWSAYIGLFLMTDILILGVGAYDLVTRGRLHPAYIAGATWIFVCELTENFLHHSPTYKIIATRLIGH